MLRDATYNRPRMTMRYPEKPETNNPNRRSRRINPAQRFFRKSLRGLLRISGEKAGVVGTIGLAGDDRYGRFTVLSAVSGVFLQKSSFFLKKSLYTRIGVCFNFTRPNLCFQLTSKG